MAQPSPMNGGDGTYSYAKNSDMQRNLLNAMKEAIKEALIDNVDMKTLLSGSTTFTIADLGCSVGPNTFLAMQNIVETIEDKYHSQGLGSKKLEFQVLFNDQMGNDFNTLFASLPGERKYFATGVPGSFHGRLFPSSSIHIAYSFYALHWLSRVPKELQIKDSPAWNTGKIHYTNSSDAVVKAYADQFEDDMEIFLRARAPEIAPGGIIIIVMPGVPDGALTHNVGIAMNFLGSILMDMVKEGLLHQDQVDSFNIPHMYPSKREMRRLVEKNGCFEIVKMELPNFRPNKEAPTYVESAIMCLRAIIEGTIANHLGSEIVDELFKRAFEQKAKFFHTSYSAASETGGQLFAVLKRKWN